MYPGRGVCGSVSLSETVWTCVDGPCKAGAEDRLRSETMWGPLEGHPQRTGSMTDGTEDWRMTGSRGDGPGNGLRDVSPADGPG